MYILTAMKRSYSPGSHDDFPIVITSKSEKELENILKDLKEKSGGFCGYELLFSKIQKIKEETTEYDYY